MTLADMLRNMTPEQQSLFAQIMQPRPGLGMSQYLPPQPGGGVLNSVPPDVARYMATTPAMDETGRGPDVYTYDLPRRPQNWFWPQDYRGWETESRAGRQGDPGVDALAKRLSDNDWYKFFNFPQNEADIESRKYAPSPNFLTRLPTGQYVPTPPRPTLPPSLMQALNNMPYDPEDKPNWFPMLSTLMSMAQPQGGY